MKKNQMLSLIDRLAAPVAITVCGLILLFRPDTASVLVSKILNVMLVILGIGSALAAAFGSENRIKNGLLAVCFFAAGRWLSQNPLGLAAGTGRFLGIIMMAGAVGGFLKSSRGAGRAYYLAAGVLGLILTLLPMTASRVVFILCGIGVTAVGIVMLLSRLRERRYLNEGDDPNIIDAL